MVMKPCMVGPGWPYRRIQSHDFAQGPGTVNETGEG